MVLSPGIIDAHEPWYIHEVKTNRFLKEEVEMTSVPRRIGCHNLIGGQYLKHCRSN
jgi:hypothetical protein